MGYICILDSNRECECCHQCEPIGINGNHICDVCNEEISEDYYYEIDNMELCESCMNDEYRRYIED